MKKFLKNSLCFTMAGALALLPVTPSLAMTQDETVYVKLSENGETKQISVVKHLINDLKETELFDRTALMDLENLNGFESFVADGENVKWEAKGNDIYYRGVSQKELPIKLEVTYELDGEKKTLDEILGKPGRVAIKLKYTNLSKVGNLYTPFVIAVATTLDESKVSDVRVTNGKATGNGRTIAVAAVAAPGLYESLGLKELSALNEITISYNTEKFELGDIYSVVTPKLLEDLDLNTFAELDELYASADRLSTSSKKLVDGSNELKNGVNELRMAVEQAKKQLQNSNSPLDTQTLSKIKQTARTEAEKTVLAQEQAVRANIKQQMSAGQPSMNTLLNMAATQICAAQAKVPACPEEAIKSTAATLIQNTENQLMQSSITTMQQVAAQTAEATAEKVAMQVGSAVQNGMGQAVVSALDQLLAGIGKLAEGANTLSSGMAQFDREGIQTMINFVNGKVKVTASKIDQLTKLAEDYDSYAGIADETEGSTKFILMIEGRK